jgi:C4-dicarboxylate transporter, DctM subunit
VTITVMTAGMLALALLNVPIAIALGLVAVIAVIVLQGPQMLPNLALVMFDGASSFPLLAIPLFIFAGHGEVLNPEVSTLSPDPCGPKR